MDVPCRRGCLFTRAQFFIPLMIRLRMPNLNLQSNKQVDAYIFVHVLYAIG